MNKLAKNIAFLLAIFFASSVAYADDFTPPKHIEGSDKFFTKYPSIELRSARTNRTWVSFMVSKDGTVSEPMIEQTNNDRFNDAVMKWMTYLKFEPATIDGEAVDSWRRTRRAFDVGYDQRSPRVSTTLFNNLNKKFGEEFAKPQANQKKLAKLLKKLTIAKHGSPLAYEFISRRRHQFAEKFLDRDDQIYALRERMLSSDKRVVWSNGTVIDEELISLLLDAGYYGEVLEAYRDARRKLNSTYRASLWKRYGTQITEIRENVDNDYVFTRPISIGNTGYTFLPLLKRNFKFDDLEGIINTVKLRCEKRFAEFQYSPNKAYQAPSTWGECQLQVLGDTGSNAQLIQF